MEDILPMNEKNKPEKFTFPTTIKKQHASLFVFIPTTAYQVYATKYLKQGDKVRVTIEKNEDKK